MHNSMNPNGLPTIVFDNGGDLIPCFGTAPDDLIQSAASVENIRFGSLTGRTTTAMRNLTGILQSIRRCTEGEFPNVCCDVSDAYNEVRKGSRMRVLTGLTPDESTLIVVLPSLGSVNVSLRRRPPRRSRRPSTKAA